MIKLRSESLPSPRRLAIEDRMALRQREEWHFLENCSKHSCGPRLLVAAGGKKKLPADDECKLVVRRFPLGRRQSTRASHFCARQPVSGRVPARSSRLRASKTSPSRSRGWSSATSNHRVGIGRVADASRDPVGHEQRLLNIVSNQDECRAAFLPELDEVVLKSGACGCVELRERRASRSSTLGRVTRARASAMRWAMPPDISRGHLPACSARRDACGAPVRPDSRRSARSTLSSPKTTLSATVSQGRRLGSWKTSPTAG